MNTPLTGLGWTSAANVAPTGWTAVRESEQTDRFSLTETPNSEGEPLPPFQKGGKWTRFSLGVEPRGGGGGIPESPLHFLLACLFFPQHALPRLLPKFPI